MTETVSGDSFNDAEHMLTKVGSVGRPVAHLEVRIVDEDETSSPSGQLGEITLRGPKVFRGYWRDEDATAQALRDGWFHTGDVGRLDEEGYLYVEDRKKDMIISVGAYADRRRSSTRVATLRQHRIAPLAATG